MSIKSVFKTQFIMKKSHLFVAALLLSFIVNAQTIEINDPALLNYLTKTNCTELYSKPGVFGSVDTNKDGIVQESEALDVKSIDLSFGRDPIYPNPKEYVIPKDIGGRLSFPSYNHNMVYSDQEIQILIENGGIIFNDINEIAQAPINLISDFTAINNFSNLESISICFASPNNFNFKNLKKLKSVKNILYQDFLNPYRSSSQGNFVLLNFQSTDMPYYVGAFIRNLNYPTIEYKAAIINELTFDNCPIVEYININELYQNYGIGTRYIHPLTTLDVSTLPLLKELDCSTSNISSLDLSKNLELVQLGCYRAKLTQLDLSYNNKLINVNCNNNAITSLKLPTTETLLELDCSSNKLTVLDLANNTKLTKLTCNNNRLNSVDISENKVLVNLIVSSNNLSSIDLNNNTALKYFNGSTNKFAAIDFSKNLLLEELFLHINELTTIDVSKNVLLQKLELSQNQLTKINTAQNQELTYISVQNNYVESIDLAYNLKLTSLSCNNNKLSSLDLTKNSELTYLNCQKNQLKVLDLSKNNKLIWTNPDLSNNNLEELNIKNGQNIVPDFSNNPALKYICVDNNELITVQTKINQYGYQNVAVNSYCSFVPGGDFYTIKGKNHDCKNNTAIIPNLRYNIKSDFINGVILSNQKGEYTIPVQKGTHTITPKLENLEYYTIAPESIDINVSSETNPIIQDFCFSPIPDKNDLEITITPIGTPARPGFDSSYKIMYKNKGTTTQSGTISLNYMDDVLDYKTASTTFLNSENSKISWAFNELKPLESRYIEVTFNVNTPQETPAVNGGDLLNYTTTITSNNTDETPKDNEHTLRITVVNSYDPNDKTCLEGDSILPGMIGEFIHYKIRFENTGTFPAKNIVIVDEIDNTKFDINTLVPLDASHSYETKITSNKVEFIFENIQLPFEDATNDGYVMFKIKTLPTLMLNDSFSNQASIYFDFNFPIITNDATTIIKEESLSNEDFKFQEQLTLYPNPLIDRLYIEPKNSTQVRSIGIYNLQGQLIQSIPQVSNVSVDVSNLPKGIYIVQVKTDKGTSTTKVVKN